MVRQRKRICHIQLLPLMSGVQRAMLEVLKRVDLEQYEVYVICKKEGDLTIELDKLGIKFFLISSLVREINPILDFISLIRLTIIFFRFKFDIVHTHSSKTGLIGRIAAKIAGTKHIYHTVHGLPFHQFTNKITTRLFSMLERFGSFFSDIIIFVNNEERYLAISKGLIPSIKAKTIYNGVDLKLISSKDRLETRKKFRDEWNIGSNEFIVGYVGRLWEQKDPLTLFKITQICADLPARFLIVGDGPYKDMFLKAYEHDSRVILTGWLDDPLSVYPAIDVLILPSLWEGLSMTLIEAMAFGKPLVASNIKGNRECILNNKNGFLCSPRAPYQFKKAIKMLIYDKNLYNKSSDFSREFSYNYFNSDKNSRAVLKLYEKSLNGSNE